MYRPEEFDSLKTKVLKYVLYKKRTKQEVIMKFGHTIDSEILDDIIENLEENGYISDNDYIERAVKEFEALNHLSIKEIKYKLLSKGLSNDIIDDYFSNNLEELMSYELDSAKIIAIKKSSLMEEIYIKQFLLKKRYREESIKYTIICLQNEE